MKNTNPLSAAPSLIAADASELETEALVVEFPAGIPGFEAHRRFVLFASADLSPLGCLKALDSPDVSFLVIDPTLL
jgi:flagellar assembly factor FliW